MMNLHPLPLMEKHPMKATTLTLLTALTAGTMAIGSANAAIVSGDTIVIDFGTNGNTTAGNWNNFTGGANPGSGQGFGGGDQALIADLVRFSDNAATGVALTKESSDVASASNSGIGGADLTSLGAAASFTVSGQIPDSAQIDLSFWRRTTESLVFSGLDTGLTYNLELLAYQPSARDELAIVANGVSVDVDPNVAPYVASFNGLSADINGEIVITFPETNATTSYVGTLGQHINAIELTAIPEPGSLALIAMGGLCVLRRRRS